MKTLCSILLGVMLWVSAPAFSCSCLPQSLEQHYLGSPNVFSAVITSIDFVECADNFSRLPCSDYEAGFETTKVFKGDIPFDKIQSYTDGALCGTTLAIGIEYLFFMNDDGQTGLCSGTRVLTNPRDSAVRDLERLEDYASGRSPDLSGPWHSNQMDGLCVLQTDFLIDRGEERPYRGQFEVYLRYAPGVQPHRSPYLENEVGYQAVLLPMPIGEPASQQPVLKMGDVARALTWKPDPDRWGGRYGLFGQAAGEFIARLKDPGEIRVQGVIPEVGRIDAEVRQTHVGTAISDFLECGAQLD